jgi:hypothetical protein
MRPQFAAYFSYFGVWLSFCALLTMPAILPILNLSRCQTRHPKSHTLERSFTTHVWLAVLCPQAIHSKAGTLKP